MNYDYAAKGREDFLAGKKDQRLYEGADKHNADYRRGWQQARREAEDRAFREGSEDITARPAPMPEPASNEVPKVNTPAPVIPFEPAVRQRGTVKPEANEGWQGLKSSTWHYFRAGETVSVCKRAHRMLVEASDKAGGLTCSICEARMKLGPRKATPPDQMSFF
jgi:hypothetical protein